MRLTDFLEDLGNPVAYYPKLSQITGGVLANLFLCQMYYWLGKQKDDEGWIYKTQIEIEEETGLTRKEQESARKSLKARGLLKEQFKGCPRRLEFWLDKDALNTCWEAYASGTELLVQEVPKAWNRRKCHNAPNVQYIMPNSCNIECTDSAIYNAPTGQYRMPQQGNTECPNRAIQNAPSGHAVMPHLGNISIYTENTSEITTERKKDPSPPHLTLDLEDLDNQEQNPSTHQATQGVFQTKNFASLLNQAKSSQQTNNPSCGSNIAPRSFDKTEQSNLTLSTSSYNSAAKCDEFLRGKALPPWRISSKDFDSEFVGHWRSMLAKSGEWRDRNTEPMNGDAKRSLLRMEKFDLPSLEAAWEAYIERKQLRQQQEQARAHMMPQPELQPEAQDNTPAPPPPVPPELRKKLDAARIKSQEEQKRRLDKIRREAYLAS